METQTVIICCETADAAAEAEKLMKAADPSQRSRTARATVFVTWHANIIASTQAVSQAGIPFTLVMGDEVL